MDGGWSVSGAKYSPAVSFVPRPIPHPTQSLCTLRDHCRQWPRNTRYQADATPYLGRTCTGWTAPAYTWRTLLDHLIGEREQRRRHFKAERLGGLEVKDQLHFGDLLDWQVGRFLSLENAAGVDAPTRDTNRQDCLRSSSSHRP